MCGQTELDSGRNWPDVDAVDRYQLVGCVDDRHTHARPPNSTPVVTARQPSNHSVAWSFAELDTIRSGPRQHRPVSRIRERVAGLFVGNDPAHAVRKPELLEYLDSFANPNHKRSSNCGEVIAQRNETTAHEIPMRWVGVVSGAYRWLCDIERNDGPATLSSCEERPVIADSEVSFKPNDRHIRLAHQRAR